MAAARAEPQRISVPAWMADQGEGSTVGKGGPHPSQTAANIVPLLLGSVVAWGQAQTPYGRWFDSGVTQGQGLSTSKENTGAGSSSRTARGAALASPQLSTNSREGVCSLGNGISSYLTYAKKHFHTNMPESLMANTAFHTHLLASLLSNSTPLPPPNNSLVTHQLPCTCRVLSRSLSAFSWDNPGHATGALHAVHNP